MITPTASSSNSFLLRLNDVHDRTRVTNDCLNTLRIFLAPGQVTQLVAFDVREPGYHTLIDYAGFFDYEHLDLMAGEAAAFSGCAKGVHFTLNPLNPGVLDRCPNRIQLARKGILACDDDVICRTFLMIDVDPRRRSGVSATDAEKNLAWNTLTRMLTFLSDHGFPEPIIGDSGNGYHLYYRIDLHSADKLPHRILKMLSDRFGTDEVNIDTTVASASQLTKLFGTVSAKGPATDDRPHRHSHLLCVPKFVTIGAGILTRILPLVQPTSSEAVPASASVGNNAIQRARGYLRSMPQSISGNHGHDRLFEAACRVIQGFGLSIAEALPLLREYNERAEPPWNEEDLRHKLEDALVQAGSRPSGYLLKGNADLATPAPSPRQKTPTEELARPLPGQVFPTSIPDFIPGPCTQSLGYLDSTDIDRPRGRPKFDYDIYFQWLGLHAIFEQKVSMIVLPDLVLSAGIGGASPPNGWRDRLILRGCKRVLDKSRLREHHRVKKQIDELIPTLQAVHDHDPFGDHEDLFQRTHELADRLRLLSRELPAVECPTNCPLHGSGKKHDHLRLKLTEPYLGIMTQFAVNTVDGVLHFDFDKQHDKDVTVLSSLVHANDVHWAYLPVQIFGQAAGMNVRQIRLIQGLIREGTRRNNNGSSNSSTPRLVVIKNAKVKAIAKQALVVCPFLNADERYIGFGGNLRKHAGKGYQLIGTLDQGFRHRGGWLRRFGYPVSSQMKELDEDRIWKWLRIMLGDLAALSPSLGLVVGAVDKTGKWRSLEELLVMIEKAQFRPWLRNCSLRIYAPADHLVRWRRWFAERLGFSFIAGGDWSPPECVAPAESNRPTAEWIRARMKTSRITGKRLAGSLGWDAATVSRQLSGKTAISDELIAAVLQLMSVDSTESR